MSISKKFYNSFTELKSVKSLAMIAMLLALRIILGFIGNSTLPFFGNNVKLSGAFLPIAITGSMFGPVPAMIVGMLGDVLSFIMNPTGGAYFPGFTINGILTGQCAEIALPTEGYYDMQELYSNEDHGRGEIAICSLGAIVICNIKSEEQYRSVAYYGMKMIDKCIHLAAYELPHIGYTSKARLNAGVGILGLAFAAIVFASEFTKFTSDVPTPISAGCNVACALGVIDTER